MKPTHCLLPSLAVLTAAAHEDARFEERSFDLESRAEMTYWQNWCVAGGAILGGIGGIAAGVAGIIYASSSTSSCTKVYQIVDSRSENSSISDEWHLNVTGVTENLQESGFNISHAGWTNFTINSDSFGGYMSATNATADTATGTDLEKRTTWDKTEVYVMYHASGTCKTAASKAKIKAAVKKALKHQSTYKREAACYTLYNNGGWLGHLKVLEVYSDGDVPYLGYTKTCNGAKGVANTC
ncbi:hypothetical protein VP1G_08131 [Cytospora mali]|uniref:Secreted protein CSS2 C-terminal domain-containing protein n=1 Tax=Cytospora mali TaxID=578113 RepID=A0A194VAP1_CYTMA|nr:hypothetical protein VP1G_08131 [Valsa mali var. pyri (nom. inval.)]